MPEPVLHCSFCQLTSSRSQGLAAHIRNRHPKQYPKWLKTPTRLEDAKKAGTSFSKSAKQIEQPDPEEKSAAVAPMPSPISAEENPTLDLLRQVHRQLLERQQIIQTELARLNGLTKELEVVNTQLEALDKTFGLFPSTAGATDSNAP